MSKNYQRRENYNEAPSTEETSAEGSQDLTSGSSVPEEVTTPAVIAPEPVAYIPELAVTPTPFLTQTTKVPMLQVQTDLTALAQAINPKQPVQARWQYTLFNLFKGVLQTQDNSEFYQQWNAILNFYESAKGTAFSDMYILRFSDEWPGSDSEFSLFRRLVSVMSQTSNPQTRRKSATMINFSRATEGLGEDAGNRLIGFYA